MDSMKRKKDTMSEDGSSRSEGVQYATGKQQRAIPNSSRKNEEAGPKQECRSIMDVPGGESEIQCCNEQYRIGA